MAPGDPQVFDDLAEGFDDWAQTFGVERFDYFVDRLPARARFVLDAGCGTGILAAQVADHAERVVGMDISRSMLRVARARQVARGKKNIDFIAGNAEALPFRDGSFDCVVSSAALYNTRLDRSLPELRRVVRPGGRIVVADLVQRYPWLDRRPAWAVVKALKGAPGHAAAFGVRTMLRVLSFRTSRAWVVHHARPKLTPSELRDAYSRHLPGCVIEDRRWDVCVSWDAAR
jgi:ubiquinone/menaquinone biosynthesis C-methylase UbiE